MVMDSSAKKFLNSEISNTSAFSINRLLGVMKALRNPQSGCPWDIEQDFKSIAPYTIEEAYEVVDAIDRDDKDDLKEELGDLLLQVVYLAQIAQEEGAFCFDDVVNAVTDKMIYRHPHVFGDETANKASDVDKIWDHQKSLEQKQEAAESKSIIDSVTLGLPALLRAQKLQKKAAKAGFEWPNIKSAYLKLEEELEELREAVDDNHNQDHITEEFGDALFCFVNYGRMLGINPEEALRLTNQKFIHRFKGMESDLKKNNLTLSNSSLDTLISYWNKQKPEKT